jgi:predicted NodU family carbamoyl transferase
MEKRRLAERRDGKLRRALGRALPGESPEELERIALEDERRAEAGLVELKSGGRVYYKHIDDLTIHDSPARIAAEREQVAWLRGRVERLRALGGPSNRS